MGIISNSIKYFQIYTIPLCVLTLLILSTEAFEYSAYCESQCMIGRGGNLCRCNAVHFAGKRTSSTMLGKGELYNTGDNEKLGASNSLDGLLAYLVRVDKSTGNQFEDDDMSDQGSDVNDRYAEERKRMFSNIARSNPYRKWFKNLRAIREK